jgi:hypothetical protein
MHRPAVAADVNRRAIDQRAKFLERELAALEYPAAIVPEERLCLGDNAIGGLPIRRSGGDDDAARRIATGKTGCHSRKRSNRPSTERVPGADVHDDQSVVTVHARARESLCESARGLTAEGHLYGVLSAIRRPDVERGE